MLIQHILADWTRRTSLCVDLQAEAETSTFCVFRTLNCHSLLNSYWIALKFVISEFYGLRIDFTSKFLKIENLGFFRIFRKISKISEKNQISQISKILMQNYPSCSETQKYQL